MCRLKVWCVIQHVTYLFLPTYPTVHSTYNNIQHRFPSFSPCPSVRWTWCLVSTFRWVVWVSVCDSPFCRTGVFWLLTFLYSCACQLYTFLFLANVRKVGGGSRGEFHVKVVNLGHLSKTLSVLSFCTGGFWQMVGKLRLDFIPGRFFWIHWPVGGKNSCLDGFEDAKAWCSSIHFKGK